MKKNAKVKPEQKPISLLLILESAGYILRFFPLSILSLIKAGYRANPFISLFDNLLTFMSIVSFDIFLYIINKNCTFFYNN